METSVDSKPIARAHSPAAAVHIAPAEPQAQLDSSPMSAAFVRDELFRLADELSVYQLTEDDWNVSLYRQAERERRNRRAAFRILVSYDGLDEEDRKFAQREHKLAAPPWRRCRRAPSK